MYDWIKLDGWQSSATENLHVLEWDAPIFPRAEKSSQSIPGRLSAFTDSRRNYKPENVSVTMAVTCGTREANRAAMDAICLAAMHAHHLTLSDDPLYHYAGYVREVRPIEDIDEWLKFVLTFEANPPVKRRVLSGQAGFMPDESKPVPEQITETNATHNVHVQAGSSVQLQTTLTAYPPEVYMLILGTWDEMTIGGEGGLVIPGLGYEAIYVDAENQQCYAVIEGRRVGIAGVRGSYEYITAHNTLQITAKNPKAVTAHILVIERK